MMGIAALHPSYRSTNLAVALPDQDQADRAEQRAIAGPLQLIDHEARWRPADGAGALPDPQQADGKRQKADDRKRSGHWISPCCRLRPRRWLPLFPRPPRKPLPAAAVASDRIQSRPASQGRKSLHCDLRAIMNRRTVVLALAFV